MADETRTYYDVLEVSEDASDAEIREARLRLARDYHPDRIPEHLTRIRVEAEERLKEVNEAFEVLRSPQLRAAYDAKLRSLRAASQPSFRGAASPPTPPATPTPTARPHVTPTATSPEPVVASAPTFLASAKKLPLILIAAGLLVTFALESRSSGWLSARFGFVRGGDTVDDGSQRGSAAPDSIVYKSACAGEGCIYGERWLARKSVTVYAEPPTVPGAPQESIKSAGAIPAGSWVLSETGVVLARRIQGRVAVQNGVPVYANGVTDGPALVNGQPIALYFSMGEGCWMAWVAGRTLPVCSVSVEQDAQSEFWVQVKTANGAKVWTNYDTGGFVSEASLNDELAQVIVNSDSPVSETLAHVDRLMKEGADLNGDSGQHGTEPIWAAIVRNDTSVMSALIARGLDVRRREPCAAYPATQGSALRPRGDLTLAFLLDNGLPLTCLTAPPLEAFLNFGLATDQYPVEQAIRVAEVLLRHGANVNEKNAQGKSIFDVLAQAPDPSRIAPLMEMLTAASAGNPLAAPSEQMAPSLGHVPIETLLANAEAQIRNGDYDRASAEADTAVTLFPGDARARALVERIRRIRSVLK